jgi:hypothetical protein
MLSNRFLRTVRSLAPVFAFVLIAVFAISCDDDPIAPQSDHFEAVGMVIFQSGAMVLDYYGPEYDAGDQTAYLDTLYASQGLNPHWSVRFYNEDGDLVDPPEEDNQWFAADFANPDLAELWWHEGEDGEFDFHLKGNQAGQTTVEFKIMHIDHADFTTLPIPLVIDETVLHGAPVGVRLYDEESEDLLATAYIAGSGNDSEGLFTLTAGNTTDHIEAIFFDEEDIAFWPGVPPHSLVVESSNTSVVNITGQEPEEPWAFKLEAVSAGTANITVYIYHDGAVGKTFTPINVVVN